MRATTFGHEGCRSWCVDTLTAIRIGSKPSVCQCLACAHALRSTHSPMLRIRPESSAIGMNSSGRTGPVSGIVQRSSASAAHTAPVSASRIGW
jgi:hypothetical protein